MAALEEVVEMEVSVQVMRPLALVLQVTVKVLVILLIWVIRSSMEELVEMVTIMVPMAALVEAVPPMAVDGAAAAAAVIPVEAHLQVPSTAVVAAVPTTTVPTSTTWAATTVATDWS